MLRSYSYIIILFVIWNLNCSGQWFRCNGEFSTNVQIQKFVTTDSVLIAGCREGVIYYDEKNNSWSRIIRTGAIIDITSNNGNIYLINASNQIKVISPSMEIIDIPFNLNRFGIKSISQLLAYNNRLYVGSFDHVFYQSLNDTAWQILKLGINLPSMIDIKKIIVFQGKLLILSRNGIFVSDDGTTGSKIIKNSDILQYGSTIANPPKPNATNSFKLKGIVNDGVFLYAYSGQEIFKSKDLKTWENYNVPAEVMQLKTICCNGIIINTLGNLYYYFDKSVWEKLPSLNVANIASSAPSEFCIFKNKIFGGLNYPDNNSFWEMNFRYSLKF